MPLPAVTSMPHISAPAGGAGPDELAIAAVIGAVYVAALALMAVAHRRGRAWPLRAPAALAERVSGMPGWAALPGLITAVSLVTAVFGFYWDVATHIDYGRDTGIFDNPAHLWILAGLLGIAASGWIAVLLGADAAVPTAVEPRRGWSAPVGAWLLLVCGAVALAGFPLDDVWHHLFGQDVTLWGPTHIQMVGGASIATLAQWVLFVEAGRSRAGTPHAGRTLPAWLWWLRDASLAGAFLIGLSTLQGEFDFGVPQFALAYQPILITLAASTGLVTARIRLGRGGALAAVAFFLLLRAGLAAVIGGGFGLVAPVFPLYVGSALLVEAVARVVPRDRQLHLGAWAGLAVGTVGLATEWAWSHAVMPIGWPTALLPGAAVTGVLAGVAGGVIGGLIGRALAPRSIERAAVPRWAGAAAIAVVVGLLAWPLPTTASPAVADLGLEEQPGSHGTEAFVTVRVDPPQLADDPAWFHVIAWQGARGIDDRRRLTPLEPVGPGTYRTTEPVPVHGTWKAIVRLHTGREMLAAPVYLPQDPVIGAAEVPASSGERAFVHGKQLLQREARDDVPRWLWGVGQAVIVLIVTVWIAAFIVGLRRLGAGAGGKPVSTGR